MVYPLIALAESATESGSIDSFLVLSGLFGGLALFLMGMDRMTRSLRVLAGDRMRGILNKLTTNRFAEATTGAGLTAVIQSSSITTVLVVGFITAGLLTLEQSVGVIMGAKIGTTVTAQIIAFKVTRYALALLGFGFAIRFLSKNESRRAQGGLIMGLGMIFFGMSVMGDAMGPLSDFEPFRDWMAGMSNPLAGVVAGAIFTAVIQSSSATTGVVLALAFEGLIGIEAGIALVLGANVGTSVTAQLAAIGKPRDALRAAWIHTIFNTIGVLVWLPFIPQLASWVEGIGGGLARQIANAHTIFNVVNTVVFIGFSKQLADLVVRFVPDRPEPEVVRPRYLDAGLMSTPALALDRARLELLRLAERVRVMLRDVVPAVISGTNSDLVTIEAMDDEVDSLYGSILEYLGRLSKEELGSRESNELLQLMEATNNLEAIGDIIETNLVQLGLSRISQELVVSQETADYIYELHKEVKEALDLAMLAVTQKNETAARRVGAMKSHINTLAKRTGRHQVERLVVDEPNRVQTYGFETDLIANLVRVFYFTRRTARVAIPASERPES
ncbi:MAG: Na/Pi cotransporter family protein [Acidimicrobiia bacterium]|nr:Na/Pi cotransporter family protein [Acidimicrobiia bacterium]MDX2465823.1 Na/Pi cotransporter family protein [Acidimicrobiia bacterium]